MTDKALTDGMCPRIIVVDDDLDDLVVSQNEWIGVHAVYSRIGCILSHRQGGSERRYSLWNIGNVIPRRSETGVSDAANKQGKLQYRF